MLETSIFILYFPYVKACQCCRFFNVTNQKQLHKNPLFWLLSFDETLPKNAKELTKGAPQSPHIISGFPGREKTLHPLPRQPCWGSPISLASIFHPKSDYMPQTGVILSQRMPPESQGDETCTAFFWIASPMFFIQTFPRPGGSLLLIWDGSLGGSD